jgi:BASS family bile acid:Na+ symporter
MAQIFVVMGIPVIAGMLVRARFPGFAARWQGKLGLVAALIFVAIVATSIFRHFGLFRQHTATLAPLVLSINIVMLLLGYGISRLARVPSDQAITVAIESAVQNAALAIVIGGTILRDEEMMLPGAIYGVMMYATGAAFVFVGRRLMLGARHDGA